MLPLISRPALVGSQAAIRVVSLFALVAVVSVAPIACSKNLSRREALSMLQDAPPAPWIERVPMVRGPCASLDTSAHGAAADWGALLRDDMVTETERTVPQGTTCAIQLTDRGKTHTDWKYSEGVTLFGYNQGWQIPVGAPKATEVTGITQDDGATHATVEFSWQFQPNASIKYFPEYAARVDTGAEFRGTGLAMLTRYDDGWRVISTDYGRSRYAR